MEIRQCNSAADVATAGAAFIDARAKEAIGERGQFTIALSGGSTPWVNLPGRRARCTVWRCAAQSRSY
jgi:6-phosphogluconolactonase/glucosamine-6-phosphate isomerase/deaminase